MLRNLIITGALGHIGSSLIEKIPEGCFKKIFLIDNLETERYESLFNLSPNKGFKFVETDVLRFDLSKVLQCDDVVIHLAAKTNPEISLKDPEAVDWVNLEGTRRVAQACLEKKSKLIFISTTSVYRGKNVEIDELHALNFIHPQTPYAASKWKAELMLEEMGRKMGLDYVACRFGTIFGVSRGMRFHTAVNRFMWQACKGVPLTVWTSAMEQIRPYLDVQDAVSALLFIIQRNLFNKGAYHVVSVNTSVEKIVEVIRSYVPGLKLKRIDSKVMNDYSYSVSANKIRDHGFVFHGGLDLGIRETWEYLHGMNPVNKHRR